MYERWLPVEREMNRLGWEPVTGARCVEKNVLTERFGGDSKMIFSIYGPQKGAREVTLILDEGCLRLPGKDAVVRDAFSKGELKSVRTEKGLEIRNIRLDADGTGAIWVERR